MTSRISQTYNRPVTYTGGLFEDKSRDYHRDQQRAKLSERVEQTRMQATHNQPSRKHARSAPGLMRYNIQIGQAVREKKIEKAWSIYHSIPEGIKRDAYTVNPILNYYVKTKDEKGIDTVLGEISREHIALDVVTYNTLIDGSIKAGKFDEAKSALRKMKAAGLQPTVVTYTTLIDGSIKAGKFDEAKSTLREMKAAGLQPTVVTYTTLIDGYYSVRDFENSKKMFQKSPFFTERLLPVVDGDRCLDLHEMSHAVACIAILLLLEYPFQETTIIHGKGLHGTFESFAMKNALVQFIENERLPFAIEPSQNEFGVINKGRSELVLDLSIFTSTG